MSTAARMPVVFLPHGGGPWPFVEMGLDPGEKNTLVRYLESVKALTPERPKALLVVSAHWEEAVPTVMTAEQPPMYYDYYGFPDASYQITWPAPGAPWLAARVQALLAEADIPTAEDTSRGFDHGTFIPLKVTYPEAEIPAIQLSLQRGLNPAAHLALGRALAPLRDEGVFIVASGMTFHNLRIFFDARAVPVAETFDHWLNSVALQDAEARNAALAGWADAPMARTAHPREEHLMPLLVAAGAAGADRAELAFHGTFAGLRLSAYHFGVAAHA